MNPMREQVMAAADRMLARGASPESVRQFVLRAKARATANERDVQSATRLSGAGKAAQLIDRAAGSASFGVAPLIGDAALAAVDPDQSFAEVRSARRDRNAQLGGAGVLADIIGGLVTGGASLAAIKGAANLGRVGKLALGAADAAAQGGITSATEGLDDLTAAGFRRAAGRGATGAAIGGAAGSVLGPLAGLAGKRTARAVHNADMRTAGINPKDAETLNRVMPQATPETIDAAKRYVSEAVAQGRGATVNLADAMDEVGAATLNAATIASQEGRGLAKARLRTRDAGVGDRTLQDLAEVTGQTPGDMALAKRGATMERKRVADELYGQAEGEGTWFDAARRGGRTLPSGANDAAQDAVRLEDSALRDEIVQSWIREFERQDPQRWKRTNAGRFMPMLEVSQALAKQMRTLASQGKIGTPEYDGVARAWEKTTAALEARSPTLPKARAAYKDYMDASDAYDEGASALNAKSGEAAREAMIAKGEYGPTFRKGYVDAMAQRVKEKAPNPNLDAAARAGRRVPQDAVDTMAEAERTAAVLGPKVREGLEARARVEGRQTRTSDAVQGNSKTPQRWSDTGRFGDLVQEASAAISANPEWWATMFGRRIASHLAKVRQEARREAVGKVVSDLMTRQGVQETLQGLYGISAVRSRSAAEKQVQDILSRVGKNAVARASARND